MTGSQFCPELGQAMFTNTPWEAMTMESHVEHMLATLGEAIHLARSGDPKGYCENPMSNTGARFECATFDARAYCWCDGNEPSHESGCPPNFRWRDFTACWYKYLGRGSSQSRPMSAAEAVEMLRECLAAVAAPTAPACEPGPGETVPASGPASPPSPVDAPPSPTDPETAT